MLGPTLSTAIAAGFAALGAAALAAPATMGAAYGVPAHDDAALAYVRATGARDAVIGAIAAAFIVRGDRFALRTTFALSSIVAVVDAVIVARSAGDRDVRTNLAVHASGAIALLLAATSLERA